MQGYTQDVNPDLSPQGDTKPWYRYFWVWFVLGLLSMSISASMTLVVMAHRHADDVVSDTWYQDGRGINQDMAAEDMARSLGMRVVLVSENERLRAQISSDVDLPMPETLQLSLRHPTIAARDAAYQLGLAADGRNYAGEGELPRGRWVATVTPSAGNWRVQQEIWIEDNRLLLEARR